MRTTSQIRWKSCWKNGANALLLVRGIACLLLTVICISCAPTVKVEAPEKPIVINMNINISHEIKVKIDRDLDSLITTKKGLF